MPELGLELPASSEKAEDIALTAVEGRLAILEEQCLFRGSNGHSLGVSYLRSLPRPLMRKANDESAGGLAAANVGV